MKPLLLILVFAVVCMAAQDSIFIKQDTIRWNKVITGLQKAPNGNITFQVDATLYPYLLPDTTNGILFNTAGVNLIWKRKDQGTDSSLVDSLWLHAKKELKKRVK
jgi:hypothetical protein